MTSRSRRGKPLALLAAVMTLVILGLSAWWASVPLRARVAEFRLKNGEPLEREAAARRLGEFRHRASVPALVRALVRIGRRHAACLSAPGTG